MNAAAEERDDTFAYCVDLLSQIAELIETRAGRPAVAVQIREVVSAATLQPT